MLLSKIYLYVELPELISKNNNETWKGYVNGIGYSIIKNISFQIGGIIIDKLDGNYLDIYSELYDRNSDELVNKYPIIPFRFSNLKGSGLINCILWKSSPADFRLLNFASHNQQHTTMIV